MKKVISAIMGGALLVAAQGGMAADGAKTYGQFCTSCHSTGAAGAPKTGDAAAWAPRIAKGNDALLQNAIKGIPGTAMMPRGLCNSCSDDDLAAAIEYMVNNSK